LNARVTRIRWAAPWNGPRRRRALQSPAVVVRALAWILLASAIAACASGPANQVVEGHAGAPGVRRVLLCPPNLVLALRPEIQNGWQPMDREVAAYLESHGLEVRRLGIIEGRRHWKQAVSDAKTAGTLPSAPGIFVSRLAQDFEFDAVVMPSLILLQTRMDANTASWDGVTRRMKVVGAPNQGAFGGLSGRAWVASLHVLVFASDGLEVFEGRGGIDFAQQIDRIAQGRSFRYELRPSASIFVDPAVLHEGVVRAFEPYLPPRDE
jgi:hypothetical protein